MTCRDFVEFLMAYLDQSLSPAVRSRFEEHMSVCPSCVTYVQTYRTTQRLAHDLGRRDGAAVPEDVPDELVAAILSARNPT